MRFMLYFLRTFRRINIATLYIEEEYFSVAFYPFLRVSDVSRSSKISINVRIRS